MHLTGKQIGLIITTALAGIFTVSATILGFVASDDNSKLLFDEMDKRYKRIDDEDEEDD